MGGRNEEAHVQIMKYYFEKTGSGFVSEPSLKDVFSGLKSGEYEMELTRKKDARTSRQNRLLWQWLTECEQKSHAGYTKEEWHDIFCQFFLPPVKKRNPLDRRKWIVVIRGTSDLSTVEFNQFLEKVRLAGETKDV